MTLVNKILASFDKETRLFYGNAFDLNNITESVRIGDDVIVLMQELVNSALLFDKLQHAYCEQAEVLLFFLTTSQFDRDSIENETRIEMCKNKLVQWLLQFATYNSDIRLVNNIQLARVYEKTDTILTGLAVSVTIKEDIGKGACA